MNKPVSFIAPPNGSADFAKYAALILRAGSLGAARRLAEAEPNLPPRVRTMLSTKAVGAATASELVAAVPGFLSASTEFLASLRSVGLFDSMLGSMKQVPRKTRAVTATLVSASSVAESAYKPISTLSLAGPALAERKAAAIIVWTRELAELIGTSGRALFEAELRRGVSAGTDAIFVSEMESILTGLTSSGTDAAAVREDLRAMIAALNLTVDSRPTWAFSVATATALSLLEWPSDSINAMTPLGGKIFGWPAIVTAALADDEAMLIDAAKIAADGGEVVFDVVGHASLQMTATPSEGASALTSLWQSNCTAGRCERLFGFEALSNDAAALMSGIAWGATSP